MKIQFLLGSKTDLDFTKKITQHLDEWGIDYQIKVASAHKVPELVYNIVTQNNKDIENLVYITLAGRSNGLSGVVAANSIHPVIACPPHSDKSDFMVNINSTLQMPSDTPVLTVIDPQNAAMAAIRILALRDQDLQHKVTAHIQKIKQSFN
ncbi:5-(carboxyamino)imidazole ribonucleotide mutase [Candidatus Peregrinibacteria bacterium HGW-Peregrinibacteria-1]|jgi:5-(carboxyamino)imidazole ribonucleotide mutase|nr:MAG: 5-(carboxyamino)imidazole ribonucleotide mutase [Candidatus Peregrinibacteria bacterium HGW-Peregrinibacteria-1]